MGKLAGKTIFITGSSRGIGKAIALRCAKDGANIVVAAKSATPHRTLPGTIYTAAEEIEKAGGKCLPCVVDIQKEDQVQKAVDDTIKRFGGIDILVNNASAIHLSTIEETTMKRYDIMNNINTRGTFLCSKLCIPHLRRAKNPHILNISPPLNRVQNKPSWFGNSIAYGIAKFGMTLCVLGMSQELKDDGIAVNALWPRGIVYTAAVEFLSAGRVTDQQIMSPDIMGDAAYAMLTKDSKEFTGKYFFDDEILTAEGVTDLTKYHYVPKERLMSDPPADNEDPNSSTQKQTPVKPKL